MLISKDNKGVANAKKELFLERRIIMQGLAHSHVHKNRQIQRRMLYYFLFRQYKNYKLFAIIICSTLQVEMCIYKINVSAFPLSKSDTSRISYIIET